MKNSGPHIAKWVSVKKLIFLENVILKFKLSNTLYLKTKKNIFLLWFLVITQKFTPQFSSPQNHVPNHVGIHFLNLRDLNKKQHKCTASITHLFFKPRCIYKHILYNFCSITNNSILQSIPLVYVSLQRNAMILLQQKSLHSD